MGTHCLSKNSMALLSQISISLNSPSWPRLSRSLNHAYPSFILSRDQFSPRPRESRYRRQSCRDPSRSCFWNRLPERGRWLSKLHSLFLEVTGGKRAQWTREIIPLNTHWEAATFIIWWVCLLFFYVVGFFPFYVLLGSFLFLIELLTWTSIVLLWL